MAIRSKWSAILQTMRWLMCDRRAGALMLEQKIVRSKRLHFNFSLWKKKKNEIVCLPAHRDTCWWGANNPLKCKSLRVSLSLSPSAFTLHNSSPLSSCSPPPFSFPLLRLFFVFDTHIKWKVNTSFPLKTLSPYIPFPSLNPWLNPSPFCLCPVTHQHDVLLFTLTLLRCPPAQLAAPCQSESHH